MAPLSAGLLPVAKPQSWMLGFAWLLARMVAGEVCA
jgi:hypothetical protein